MPKSSPASHLTRDFLSFSFFPQRYAPIKYDIKNPSFYSSTSKYCHIGETRYEHVQVYSISIPVILSLTNQYFLSNPAIYIWVLKPETNESVNKSKNLPLM